jgi:cytochrome P450
MDPPRHTSLRRYIGPAMSPRAVSRISPELVSMMREFISLRSPGEPPGEEELQVLATQTVCLMMGIPYSHVSLIAPAAAALGSGVDASETEDRRPFWIAERTLSEIIRSLIVRHELRTGVLTTLLRRCGSGEITLEEVVKLANVLIAGGVLPVARGFAAITGLAPVERQQMRGADSSDVDMVEECMRLSSPVKKGIVRIPLQDVAIGGAVVPRGSAIVPAIALANRDQTEFVSAEQFDPTRGNLAGHLAFGSGIHSCPGSHFARAQMMVMYRAMLNRQ